jgi:RimJ/RimL family protein N-acetyltransferase
MFMPPKIQAEGGLILHKPEEADAEELCDSILFSEADLSPWMVWLKPDYAIDDALAWIREVEDQWDDSHNWAYLIRSPRESVVLGSIGINRVDKLNLVGNLGYWMRSDQAGKGIAPRAARALCAAAFQYAGLRRIELVIAADNLRSQMVAVKLGAEREATLKNRIRTPDGQKDGIVYALFPE